jgi:ATPase involved in DNA replication initiation
MKRDQQIQTEITALKERIKNLEQLLELRAIANRLESEVMDGYGAAEITKVVSEIVCRRYNLDLTRLVSKAREQPVVLPRQIAFYLIRSMGSVTFERIGASFGRDHGTIMHGCRSVADRIATQNGFAQEVENLKLECRKALRLNGNRDVNGSSVGA